jgi:hypothetical protein
MSISLSNEEINEIIFEEVRTELARQQQLSAYTGRAADKVYCEKDRLFD